MAVLSRLAARIWNITCILVLGLFCAFPLALLACFTTGLAIFFTWLLAYRMVGAAISNRLDTWRSSDEAQADQAQLQEFVQAPVRGPSSSSRQASGVPRSSRPVSGSSRGPSTANDRGFDLSYDYGYGHDIANDDDEDDGSEALWLGGWRRHSGSRSSPNASTSATPATTTSHYNYRHRSNSNGVRGVTNFSSPYAGISEAAQFDSAILPNTAPSYYSSVSLPPPPAAPVAANVAARRSTTSVGSRRSSRVLSAESVRRDVGEDA